MAAAPDMLEVVGHQIDDGEFHRLTTHALGRLPFFFGWVTQSIAGNAATQARWAYRSEVGFRRKAT
jgi:hypothetical protein